jgi:hypothetical protein
MTNDEFIISVQVAELQFQIDGLLVMAEIALTGTPEPTNAQLIEIVKRCLRPKDQAGNVTDAEALAIGLRVSMKLRELGKALAP